MPDRRPLPTFTFGCSLRLWRRTALVLHVALGRYWVTGFDRNRWVTEARLPFLAVGVNHVMPYSILARASFMGWRGADHAPSPALRVWRWPTPERTAR